VRVSKSFSFLGELGLEGKARRFVFQISLFKLTEGVELLLFFRRDFSAVTSALG